MLHRPYDDYNLDRLKDISITRGVSSWLSLCWQDALHQVPHPRMPLRDARMQWIRHLQPVSGPLDDTHGRSTTRSSCHPRAETRTPESEYRRDTRRVEHLQTSMGCVRVRIRSRPVALSSRLFQCAGDELGDSMLKTDPSRVSKPTSVVMAAIKSLAVIVVATGMTRAELARMQQERDESFRAFAARVRGKAKTCAYITTCTCLRKVDFIDSIIRDVLMGGIADLDIRREVLGTCAVNDVISLVESKDMARNALPSSASDISSFKLGRPASAAQPHPSDRSQTALCPYCKQTFALFSEGARGWNTLPHRQCIKCYRGRRVRQSGASPHVDANPYQPQRWVPYSRKWHC